MCLRPVRAQRLLVLQEAKNPTPGFARLVEVLDDRTQETHLPVLRAPQLSVSVHTVSYTHLTLPTNREV